MLNSYNKLVKSKLLRCSPFFYFNIGFKIITLHNKKYIYYLAVSNINQSKAFRSSAKFFLLLGVCSKPFLSKVEIAGEPTFVRVCKRKVFFQTKSSNTNDDWEKNILTMSHVWEITNRACLLLTLY